MQNADWNYLNSVISFFIGLLSGFQAIYVRYPRAPITAALTLPGSVYLLTRGAFPACIFAVLYHYELIRSHLFLLALALGVGAETVLRSQILIRQSSKAGGEIDDLIKGPLDLLRWYQDIFLVAIGTRDARKSKQFVRTNLPAEGFETLCQRVRIHAGAFPDPIAGLEEAIVKLEADFAADNADADAKNNPYRLKLAYIVLRLAGKENFRTLFEP